MMINLDQLKDDLLAIASTLGHEIPSVKIVCIDRGEPHTPAMLRQGQMAVYLFEYQGQVMKVGKAGPKSNARFASMHYNPSSSKSNLSKSLLADPEFSEYGLDALTVGPWIRNNMRRVDILLDADVGIYALNLIESCLQYRFKPRYEGFMSQSLL